MPDTSTIMWGTKVVNYVYYCTAATAYLWCSCSYIHKQFNNALAYL
jgi:hypothetical protein